MCKSFGLRALTDGLLVVVRSYIRTTAEDSAQPRGTEHHDEQVRWGRYEGVPPARRLRVAPKPHPHPAGAQIRRL
jgi:hypothetical protein